MNAVSLDPNEVWAKMLHTTGDELDVHEHSEGSSELALP